jgi:biotin carboxylase
MPPSRHARLLYVYVKGGPTLEFAVPSVAQFADVHVLMLVPHPLHAEHLWRDKAASLRKVYAFGEEQVVDVIVETAREIQADGIMTVSEFGILGVSKAAEILGLRGAGPNVIRSRDKRLMREVWHNTGVPSPDFRRVSSLEQLKAAVDALNLPLLLKAAWGAGSLGQVPIYHADDVEDAWRTATDALDTAFSAGFMELVVPGSPRDLLVEEVIKGSTDGWYEPNSGYGDYLSVEGIVDGGVYHPLCITSRIPTISPFTELGNLAPCELSEERQRAIEQVARDAVDALELDTCATHTELKLTSDGGIALIESAARPGGVNIARQMKTVFGLNPVAMLARALLGQPVDYPERMLTTGSGAAGSVSIIATDSSGRAWADRDRIWDSREVDWDRLISPDSNVEVVTGVSIPDGNPMPRYGAANGATDYAGLLFLTARDAPTLLHDSYSVLDGLERVLKT